MTDDDFPTFTPVLRHATKRHDGWTAVRQRDFIMALAASGSVIRAAQSVGKNVSGAYKLRVAADGASFARAWDAALARGARAVRDVLIDQAINGEPVPIVYGGKQTGEVRRFNHRSMMWLMQHHLPEDYPGGSTLHRRGWGDRAGAAHADPLSQEKVAEARATIERRVVAVKRRTMRDYAADPAKRAAYDVLHGPQDWAVFDAPNP
jgi:hypothetical protein